MSTPFDPNTAGNLEDMEKQFAVKAVLQAQTYWSLLEKKKGSDLRLTKIDDEIYDDFVAKFPEFIEDPSKAADIDEEAMKSKEGKERWRNFINQYEKKIDDFNYGCLLRKNVKGEYSEENSIFVVRMQFYAIEIFRNRHCMNDWQVGSSSA